MLTFRATTLTLTTPDGRSMTLDLDPPAEIFVEPPRAPLALSRVIEFGSVTYDVARLRVSSGHRTSAPKQARKVRAARDAVRRRG